MRIAILRAALWFSQLFLAATALAAGEQHTREDIQRRVALLYDQGKYAELEQVADSLREREVQTTSGVWQLAVFYQAVGGRFASPVLLPGTPEEGARFVDAHWSKHEKNVLSWKASFPHSPTPDIALAMYYLRRGVDSRGGDVGWAVAEDSWKVFRENLTKSRAALENNLGARRDPHWYAVMIEVTARQADDQRFHQLLGELAKDAPTYQWAWFMATYYLQPKWGGSYESIEALANFAERSNSGTAEGDAMYARIYWSLSGSIGRAQLFTETKVSWDRMNRSFQSMIRQYPDAWNINNYAVLACYAGDIKTLAVLLDRIGSHPDPTAWGSATLFDRCRTRAKGASPPFPEPPTTDTSAAHRRS